MWNALAPQQPVQVVVRCGAPILFVLAFLFCPFTASAATLDVDGSACTLPDAIEAANTDTAVGGCTAGSGADLLRLTAPIYSLATGPYDYHGLTATPSVVTTIVISGGEDSATVERSGSAPYRLFDVGKSGDLTLQNVTIRNGSVESNGGAIFNRGALTLVDCQLFSNSATEGDGGAIYNGGGNVTLTNCDFVANTAKHGGALCNDFYGTATLADSDFDSNTAGSGGGIFNDGYSTVTLASGQFTANAGAEGGAILNNHESTMTLTDTYFISNTAKVWGGGIANNGIIALTNSRFTANTAKWWGGGLGTDNNSTIFLSEIYFAQNSAYGGGGLAANQSTIALTNSHFLSNTASVWGGGIDTGNSTITFSGCDFTANQAGEGGGIANRGSTATFNNCNFSANRAREGGGIVNVDSTAIFTNTAVISNTAELGGGIANLGKTITLVNAEIRANVAISSGGGIYQENGQTTIVRSRILDNSAGATGGALQQLAGTIVLTQSCIVNNTEIAVDGVEGSVIDAANNWWGAPDGPSGAGSGAGDSVSNQVTANPILTSTILECPLRVAPNRPNQSRQAGASAEAEANRPEDAQSVVRAPTYPPRSILYLDFVDGAEIKSVNRDGIKVNTGESGILLGWSPQGDRFAYLAMGVQTRSRLTIATPGEESRLIFEPEMTEVLLNTGRQSVWSPDGSQIALILVSSSLRRLLVVLVDADSGEIVDTFAVDQEISTRFYNYSINVPFYPTVDWSPDGQKLLLGLGDLVVLDLHSGAMKPITSDLSSYWLPDQAQWLPSSDGVLYLDGYVLNDDGTLTPPQLWRIRLDAEDPEMLLTTEQLVALGLEGSDQYYTKLSPLGRYLALVAINNGEDEGTSLATNLLIFDVATLERAPIDASSAPPTLPTALAEIVVPGMAFSMEWSPDEQELAFLMLSDKGATIELLPWSEDVSRTLATVDLNEDANQEESAVNWVFMGFTMVSWMP